MNSPIPIESSESISKVKYHPEHQNVPQRKGLPRKQDFQDVDSSLKLHREFKRGDWRFHRIIRLGHWSLFEKVKNGSQPECVCTAYEVVRIRKLQKERLLPSGKKLLKGLEMYPPSCKWGTDGFSYPTLGEAHKKIISLTQDGKDRL